MEFIEDIWGAGVIIASVGKGFKKAHSRQSLSQRQQA